MKNKKTIFNKWLIALFIVGYALTGNNLYSQTPSLEFAKINSDGNPTGNGPVSTTTINFVRNSNNPTGNTFALVSPTKSATFTVNNQQYANIGSGSTKYAPVLIGTALQSSNSSPAGNSIFPLMVGSNSNYTSVSNTNLGTGIDVNQNRGVFFCNYTYPLRDEYFYQKYYMSDVTITFNTPVNNPVLQIYNLGAGMFTTQTGSTLGNYYTNEFELDLSESTNVTSISRLSGSTYFSVTGNQINNTRTSIPSTLTKEGGSVLFSGNGITQIKLKVYIRGVDAINSSWANWHYNSTTHYIFNQGVPFGISISLDDCNAGTTAPSVNTSVNNICPTTTVNLNTQAHTETTPSGASLVWFTSATRAAGTEVSNPVSVGAGTYYAFYYSSSNGGCYSPASDAVVVTINSCPPVICNGTQTEYRVDVAATLAQNTIATNGGTLNLVFSRFSGTAIPGVADTFTIPVQYSGMNNTTGTGAINKWQSLVAGSGSLTGYIIILPTTTENSGGIYHNLPSSNQTSLLPNANTGNSDKLFNHYIGNTTIQKLGNFSIDFGNFPSSFPSGVSVIEQNLLVKQTGNHSAVNSTSPPYNLYFDSGYFLKPDLQSDLQPTDGISSTNAFEVQPGQAYSYWYSAFSDGDNTPPTNGGVRGSGIYGSLTLCYSCAPTVEIDAVTPPEQNVCLGGTPSALVAAATGTGTLSYQWYSNSSDNNTSGTLITGANSASYTPPASVPGTVYYYAVVSDTFCVGTTASSTVSVTTSNVICSSPCTQLADDYTTAGQPTKVGITVQKKQPGWPENIPNGFITLESKEKGFVITRVSHVGGTSGSPTSTDSIEEPREGMMVYDIQDSCVKLFNGEKWKCIEKSCNTAEFTLNCSDITISGDTQGPSLNFTITIPYSNGDGTAYANQIMDSITSMGLPGLTANLSAGTLENGSGVLIISVSGTVDNGGPAYFQLEINGHSCLILASIAMEPGEA